MEKKICIIFVLILLHVSFNYCQSGYQLSSNSNLNLRETGSNAHKKNFTGSRYCGNELVRAMRLICDGYYAEPSLKRSLDDSPKKQINRKYKIWKKRFNLKDSDLITWTELDTQYQLLFGSEVHQNNFLPFYSLLKLPSLNNEYKGSKNRRKRMIKRNELNKISEISNKIKKRIDLIRSKRGIYEDCCARPCTLKYMKSYCLNSLL